MPDLVNPLAAYRDAYSLLEGQAQDRAQRSAGNALAGGDYQGAQATLYGRGMLQEGQAVGQMQQGQQDRQMAMQAAQAEAQKKQAAELLTMLGNVNEAVARIPAEQRAQFFATQIAPQLRGQPGVTEEALAQMMDPSYDWTDQGIIAHRALIGQAAQKLQVVPRGNGGYDVLDMGTGAVQRSVEPTPEAAKTVEGPDGLYERQADGSWRKVAKFGAPPRTFAPPRSAGGGKPKVAGAGSGISGMSTEDLLKALGG